jgi:hypothetical protein
MVETDLLLECLVVPLDAPPELGQSHEGGRDVLAGRLDSQNFFGASLHPSLRTLMLMVRQGFDVRNATTAVGAVVA